MSQPSWDKLYQEATARARGWRDKHQGASLIEIEDEVDKSLAALRAKMIEELAQASVLSDIRQLEKEGRPKCYRCGEAVNANGQKKRRLITDHEQAVVLRRSKVICPRCGVSYFPPG